MVRYQFDARRNGLFDSEREGKVGGRAGARKTEEEETMQKGKATRESAGEERIWVTQRMRVGAKESRRELLCFASRLEVCRM